MVAFSDSSRGQTMEDTFSAAASGGATNPSGFGNNGGGGDNNDPYQGFVQASQPRGLSAIDRAVRDTVQNTKDFLSNPVNKRGILGGLLGGVLFGPLGALLGGSLGQRYGGTVSSFFQGQTPNTANTEIDMLTRSGMLQNQFLMPTKQPGITSIEIPNFPEGMELYADASLKNQNRQLLENILNRDFKIDEALDKEQFKQDRQQELLNEIKLI
jgi:hypothetical protein